MPNLNGTGPHGQGSMTGRKKGCCNDTKTAQTEKSTEQSIENKDVVYGVGGGGKARGIGGSKGQGRGRGRGRGL
jgi:Family of unknown function (DUF5320)